MKDNNLIAFFKAVYNKAYLFIGVNIFALVIIFFFLDQKTGGGFMMRVFTFLFCLLVGGGLGAYIAKKNNGNPVKTFRRAGGSFLMFMTLLLWMNSGYKPNSKGGSYANYPKNCNAGCGYKITSSTYDCDGYHCTCVPGKDGESSYSKAKRY